MRALLPLLLLATPALAEVPTQFGAGFCYERTYAAGEFAAPGASQRVSKIRFEDAPAGPDEGDLVSAKLVISLEGAERSLERPVACEGGPSGRLACQVAGGGGGFLAAARGSNLTLTVGEAGLLRGELGERALLSNPGADRRFEMAPCQ